MKQSDFPVHFLPEGLRDAGTLNACTGVCWRALLIARIIIVYMACSGANGNFQSRPQEPSCGAIKQAWTGQRAKRVEHADTANKETFPRVIHSIFCMTAAKKPSVW
jgi:hypothetical protein